MTQLYYHSESFMGSTEVCPCQRTRGGEGDGGRGDSWYVQADAPELGNGTLKEVEGIWPGKCKERARELKVQLALELLDVPGFWEPARRIWRDVERGS